MNGAYGPNASSFLENAFKPKPWAAVLIARFAQTPFYLFRIAQVENHFQSNIETPSGSLHWDGNHPFEIRSEFSSWISAMFMGKASTFMMYFYFLPWGHGADVIRIVSFFFSL